MPNPDSENSTRLTMQSCHIVDGEYDFNPSVSFSAQINPASFTHNRGIEYEGDAQALGANYVQHKFKASKPESVGFELILDGTGVVPEKNEVSVSQQIEELCRVVYRYDGEKHETNHVRIAWGTFIFYGRLLSMNTTYTFFDRFGQALRAKVALSFESSVSYEEQTARENRSSPDLSHTIEVRTGDTLPLLCKKVYGDDRYYADVARFNCLSSFRSLVPGTKLHFPPLE